MGCSVCVYTGLSPELLRLLSTSSIKDQSENAYKCTNSDPCYPMKYMIILMLVMNNHLMGVDHQRRILAEN